jgi:hypothetical protein
MEAIIVLAVLGGVLLLVPLLVVGGVLKLLFKLLFLPLHLLGAIFGLGLGAVGLLTGLLLLVGGLVVGGLVLAGVSLLVPLLPLAIGIALVVWLVRALRRRTPSQGTAV